MLTRLRPDQAFVNYDQRGWGDSANAPGPYAVQRLADDAQSIIATLRYNDFVPRWALHGRQSRASARVTTHGSGRCCAGCPCTRRAGRFHQTTAGSDNARLCDEQAVEQSIDRMLTYQPLAAELRQQIVEDSLRAGDEARLEWPKYGLAQDVSVGLFDVDVAVLVLAGNHDKVEPPAVLAEHLLPLMSHTSMTVLQDTGHLSPLEVPDQVASHITTFTAQLNELPR